MCVGVECNFSSCSFRPCCTMAGPNVVGAGAEASCSGRTELGTSERTSGRRMAWIGVENAAVGAGKLI